VICSTCIDISSKIMFFPMLLSSQYYNPKGKSKVLVRPLMVWEQSKQYEKKAPSYRIMNLVFLYTVPFRKYPGCINEGAGQAWLFSIWRHILSNQIPQPASYLHHMQNCLHAACTLFYASRILSEWHRDHLNAKSTETRLSSDPA